LAAKVLAFFGNTWMRHDLGQLFLVFWRVKGPVK
jgi:hypothetical protein